LVNLQKLPQFRLEPETWLYEGGIASNRLSSWSGEYVRVRVQTARQTPKVSISGNY